MKERSPVKNRLLKIDGFICEKIGTENIAMN